MAPPTPRSRSRAKSSAARSTEYRSSGSWPARAFSIRALSSTVRVMGPTWSRLQARGKTPLLAHAPEGRLHADDAAEGRRDADGTACVRAHGAVAEAGGDRGARTAAGSARDPAGVVRIPRRPEKRAVARRPVGELVGVGLADQDGSSILELPGDGRAAVGDVLGEEGGGHRRADVSGGYQILDGDGNAVQRAVVPSGRDLRFGQRRLLQRPLRRHRDEGVGLVALDATEQRLHDLDRREASLLQVAGEGGERAWQICVMGQNRVPSPITMCSISQQTRRLTFRNPRGQRSL